MNATLPQILRIPQGPATEQDEITMLRAALVRIGETARRPVAAGGIAARLDIIRLYAESAISTDDGMQAAMDAEQMAAR